MTRLTTVSYTKIALILLISLLLGGFALFGSSCVGWGLSLGGGTALGSANVPTEGVRGIAIDWAAGSVDVQPSDGDTIELIETADRGLTKAQAMRWKVEGGTLKVDYGGWMSCLSFTSKHLTVKVPRALAASLETLDIDGASGDYHVADMSSRTFDFDLASGKLEAERLAGDELKVDLASGKATVDVQVTEKVRLHTASGRADIALRETMPHTIDADLASGTVVVSVPQNDGFTARVDKASGQFTTEFETTMQGDNLYVHGNGSANVDVDLASGSFALNKTN